MFQTARGKLMGLLTVSFIFAGGFVFGKTDLGLAIETRACTMLALSCSNSVEINASEVSSVTNEPIESVEVEPTPVVNPSLASKQIVRDYATEKTNAINQMEADIRSSLSQNIIDVHNNKNDVTHLNRDISLEVFIEQLANRTSSLDENTVMDLNKDLQAAYDITKTNLTKLVIKEKHALLQAIDSAKYATDGTIESIIEPKMILIHNDMLVEKRKLEEKQEYIIQSYALITQSDLD